MLVFLGEFVPSRWRQEFAAPCVVTPEDLMEGLDKAIACSRDHAISEVTIKSSFNLASA
jgi:hypothetical protein